MWTGDSTLGLLESVVMWTGDSTLGLLVTVVRWTGDSTLGLLVSVVRWTGDSTLGQLVSVVRWTGEAGLHVGTLEAKNLQMELDSNKHQRKPVQNKRSRKRLCCKHVLTTDLLT